MKKVFVLFIALCIGISFSYAENDENTDNSATTTNMTGKVVDKITGETLAGVMVSLDGTDKYVFSDFDGNFTFENLKPAEYDLTLSLISYEKSEFTVDLSKCKEEVKIKLETVN
jgi:hypothetical protein